LTFKEILLFAPVDFAPASTSIAMSTALTECVIAPTDTKSTPASAAARADSGVILPEASVVTRARVASL